MNTLNKDNHGECINCGFDLNGERVYDYFLKEYEGDFTKALATASMYGCKKGYGRFGKEVLVKDTDTKERYFKCPSCGERCYG